MMDATSGIVVGVDAHTDTHDAAALDGCGRLLGTRTFQANATGYRKLLRWALGFGPIAAIGVESTGSYAAGLVRHLRAEGVEVLEVNQPHPHTRRRRGKSDPIDAELAARHVLAASSIVIAKDTTGIVEAVRQLRVARDGAIKARSAALNALGGLIVTAPEELRQQLLVRKSTRGRATLCARFRVDLARLHEPAHAAKAALRSLARRVIDRRRDQAARSPAQATRRRRARNNVTHRRLHRSRRHAVGDRRPEHRAPQERGLVRCAVRRQPHPGVDRAQGSPPPQLGRRPRR
jgi:transposase